MVTIGFILIPIIILIIKLLGSIKIKKINRILLNCSLILISLIYLIFCFVVNQEPFKYNIYTPFDYMLYSTVIFMFTPFMWIVTFYFAKKVLNNIRIRKNAIIKKDEEYIYYRDDLNKVSPSIVMFTSTFDVDIKKAVSATILKLKLMGYIKEENKAYKYTNKDEKDLLESEKMVLNLVKSNQFDNKKYKKVVEEETLNHKYIAKNRGGIFLRILKILVAIAIPIFMYILSFKLDNFVFENYHIWPEDDGKTYIELGNDDEIENIYNNEIKDESDYYGRIVTWTGKEEMSYDYNKIRADKFEYSVVRKAIFLNLLSVLSIAICIVLTFVAIYIVINQIIYINKNYRRTIKGKILLNKAYALKNYLKDYSLIKDRTEEELVLWEYYLVYAVILNVNEKLQDEIIESYIKD